MVRQIYKPVEREKVSVKVRNQIKSLIIEGKLKPGEILPPERELVSLLNVSRPSIREATNSLIGMGFLDVTHGNKIIVKSIVPTEVFSPLDHFLKEDCENIFEFIEVRKAMETWNASLAAKRATPEDIIHFEAIIDSMKRTVDEGGSFPDKEDANFHLAIAMATHNTVQVHMMSTIWDIMIIFIGKYYRSLKNGTKLLAQHIGIFEAIKQKNPALATQRIYEHLDFAEDQFRELMHQEKGLDEEKTSVRN
jgi:GntR family transcriptional regulator, transcriptional repressor for pyruvate dehydrogenase complex